MQPVFEIDSGGAYLVAFDGGAAFASTVIAEVEVVRGAGELRLRIDPALTMLSAGGMQKASVSSGSLEIGGPVRVFSAPSRRPPVRERN